MEDCKPAEEDYFTIKCYFQLLCEKIKKNIIDPAKGIIFYHSDCYHEILLLVEDKEDPSSRQKERAIYSKSHLAQGIINYYADSALKKFEFCDEFVKEALKSELQMNDKISQALNQYVDKFIKHMHQKYQGKWPTRFHSKYF
ncbi:hypothetical protein RF11_07200 [Thelohanellus kitauei]|uniref:Uncharacterized protein n=1 Tax=Thelohanellus kitauei TaxID=669202 RepID=A0A0C2MXW1_THEKT|nr:hypothetical protein RF11_07200 [Thelohanellus kitauei]